MATATCPDELVAARARLARWTGWVGFGAIKKLPSRSASLYASPAGSSSLCAEQLKEVEAAAALARQQLGAQSCQRQRRGPTGGYCLRKDKPQRGGNDCLAPGFAAALVRHAFIGSAVTVLDLGAGIGQYGTFFRSYPPASHITYVGLDGAENVEESTKGNVRFADLTDGVPRDIRALPRVHWAMSLEVAEHVPRSGEARFMHAVASLPTDGVVLSWATPGQPGGGGGARHVNCQWASYADCAMAFLGFDYDAALVAKLGKHTRNSTFPCHWLRPNIMAFRRRTDRARNHLEGGEEVALLRRLLGGPAATPEFEGLYLNVTATRCEHVDGRRACGCHRDKTSHELVCPTCSESGPRRPRVGPSCAACDECARLHRPRSRKV